MSGVYVHHGGGRYRKLFEALESTNARAGDRVVVYVSLTTGRVHVRDYLEFSEVVEWPDGFRRPRFIPEEQ